MSSLNKGLGKVQVTLKWDPSPSGTPAHDLDIIAAVYSADAPQGSPAYLVHFGSRSPDGTITLNRDSRNGQGFGSDEVMTLELDRLDPRYVRAVVGIAVQQRNGHRTFGEVANTAFAIHEGYDELAKSDFTEVGAATAATVAEFLRNDAGIWEFRRGVRGFDTDPTEFTELMGTTR